MSEVRDLLIEIGTEELPPKALLRLSEAFAEGMATALDLATLKPSGITRYASPRRLALLITDLPVIQQDQESLRRGPALSAAFDEEGCPSKAALGFARSSGVEVEQLDKLETAEGAWLAFRAIQQGQPTSVLLPDMLHKALAGLPVPKRMRWGDRSEEFVRPVHWVVLLFGNDVIDTEILGVKTGRHTRGHRFHHPDEIYLAEPQAYMPILETEGQVLADYAARREAIRAQVMEQATLLNGEALLDEALLDEVTALVEWPVAISGRFDSEFLDVPSEALISSMQDHQKYFPVVDANKKLLPHFITIANIVSKDPNQIRKGNERVIRPRLSDAAFFWNQDRRQKLEQRSEGLRKMVFQKKLGTLYDKQQRVAAIAALIASRIGADSADAERAAQLCKCDLLTNMVFEFPELQGIMGHYYALHDGERPGVAAAIEEHYHPRFAGDSLPGHAIGQALALADRIDSLVGIFAIGQTPSGDKDPFALRRAALGVVRICIEGQLDLDLEMLLQHAADALPPELNAPGVVMPVFDYIMERLRGYYQDTDIDAELIDAVLAVRPTRLLDLDRRVQACSTFRALPEAVSLAAANKRISNILKKSAEEIPVEVDSAVLVEAAERVLAEKLAAISAIVDPQLDAGDYASALVQLAALREPVDKFFDDVMVMADDERLRTNRLALLQNLRNLFLRVADVSRLHS